MEVDSGIQSGLSAECGEHSVDGMAVSCFFLEDLLNVVSCDGLNIR